MSAILVFFAEGERERERESSPAARSPETTTAYSEKRQPVFHVVSPFCPLAASRSCAILLLSPLPYPPGKPPPGEILSVSARI